MRNTQEQMARDMNFSHGTVPVSGIRDMVLFCVTTCTNTIC